MATRTYPADHQSPAKRSDFTDSEWLDRKRRQGVLRTAKYCAAHRDVINAKQRAQHAAHPEVSAAYARKRRAEHPGHIKLLQRRANYRLHYGLTLEEIGDLITAQNGVCPICGIVLVFGGKVGAHVDHDHATGSIRGVLCGNCNVGLGMLKDSPDVMRLAIEYLERGAR